MNRLSREQEVLYRLIRGEEPDFSADIDWPYFCRLVDRHKILPFLEAILPVMDDETKGIIRDRLQRWSARSLVLYDELRTLTALFSSSGIPSVSLKGPVLSQQLYGNFHSRYYSDLDILVPEDRYKEAVDLLLAQNYILKSPGTDLSPAEWKAYFEGANDIKFGHPERRIIIELHLGIYVQRLLVRQEQFRLTEQTTEQVIGTESFRVLSPEINFIYLCLHAAKHMFFRLCWLRDINAFISGIELDHAQVLSYAQELDLDEMLILSVGLVERYFGAKPPEVYRPYLKKLRYRRLIRMACKLIDGPYNSVNQGAAAPGSPGKNEKGIDSGIKLSTMQSMLFLVLLRKGTRNKAAYLWYQVKKRVFRVGLSAG